MSPISVILNVQMIVKLRYVNFQLKITITMIRCVPSSIAKVYRYWFFVRFRIMEVGSSMEMRFVFCRFRMLEPRRWIKLLGSPLVPIHRSEVTSVGANVIVCMVMSLLPRARISHRTSIMNSWNLLIKPSNFHSSTV